MAAATYGVYKEKCDTKVRLLAENDLIVEEKKVLMAEIEKSQGDMSQYHERQQKCSEQKADLEIALTEAQNKLVRTEQNRIAATNDKKALEQETVAVKKDIADIEMIINKLNKEKKHLTECGAKSSDDLQVASDKVDHLAKIKQKLESTLDELEASVEKEKRARTGVEKERRKVEGELKMAQETVADIERSKKELEAGIARKEGEISGLQSKLEDEQSLVGKVQKSIKELQGRIEEMEEELEAERQARSKAERQRSDLA